MTDKLTHLDEGGRARMVDVSDKAITAREAIATGRVRMSAAALTLAREGNAKKGDVYAAAELAGVMAAKRTSSLIPLCHPLPLTSIKVEVAEQADALSVTAQVKTTSQTGVEMEALCAVSVACLTIYDMLKAVDRTMVIENITLLEKRGGASGEFVRGR